MNGEHETMTFVLPSARLGESWQIVVETSEVARIGQRFVAGAGMVVAAGSVIVLVDAFRTAASPANAGPNAAGAKANA